MPRPLPLATLVLAAVVAPLCAAPIVNTVYGPVSGMSSVAGTIAFLGIPFAAPPVGQVGQPATRRDALLSRSLLPQREPLTSSSLQLG